jgi:hypothetical protein
MAVLCAVDRHPITGLKIADLRLSALLVDEFSRTRSLNGRKIVIVGLDGHVFIADLAQHADERILIVILILIGGVRILLPAALTAGISDTGNNDLAKAGNAGQKENGQG